LAKGQTEYVLFEIDVQPGSTLCNNCILESDRWPNLECQTLAETSIVFTVELKCVFTTELETSKFGTVELK